MEHLLTADYDGYRHLINQELVKGTDPDRLRFLALADDDVADLDQLKGTLAYGRPKNADGKLCPKITVEDWFAIFDAQLEVFESTKVNTVGVAVNSGFKPSENVRGNWQRYLWKLRNEKHYPVEAVQAITDSCVAIMKRLRFETPADGEAVKGLVVGDVQSGKTGNMAGVIAMAADAGFNVFIVLSGMIENLRVQTQNRLIRDLSQLATSEGYKPDVNLDYSWIPISHPEPNTDCLQPNQLYLVKNRQERYLTICLKNSKRLRSLIAYLQHNVLAAKEMKILVIDDECDQGSVNTANLDRDAESKIYSLITGVCNHERFDGLYKNTRTPFKDGHPYGAMNYIAYTATPYATLLNDGAHTSLFPRDFIVPLRVSRCYFGGGRLFGDPEGVADTGFETHPFLNEIPADEVEQIEAIREQSLETVPDGLQQAILWFLATAAVRRLQGKEHSSHAPVSMLIHTAMRTDDHQMLGRCVEEYLENLARPFLLPDEDAQDAIIIAIQSVYEDQCQQLPLAKFHQLFPDYGEQETPPVNDYPPFADLIPELERILGKGVQPININAEEEFKYFEGVHFCLDNSRNNGIQNIDDEGRGEYLRIKYPNPDIPGERLGYEPIFLVIGGNTLARGLTLEGLTCTYFSRHVQQIDTLQQMGRFFGYRIGYELLPRIWVSDDMRMNFRAAYLTDAGIRSQLESLPQDFKLSDLCISVQAAAQAAPGTRVTAKNKMQKAVFMPALSGTKKELLTFSREVDVQHDNLAHILKFLDGLGPMTHGISYGKSNYFKLGIPWVDIRSFIAGFKFPDGVDNINVVVLDKYVKKHLEGKLWTVVVAGRSPHADGANNIVWGNAKYEVGMNLRTPVAGKGMSDSIHFHNTSSAADLLTDIDMGEDCPVGTPVFTSDGNPLHYRRMATLRFRNETPILLISGVIELKSNCVAMDSGRFYGLGLGFPVLDNASAAHETAELFVGNLEE